MTQVRIGDDEPALYLTNPRVAPWSDEGFGSFTAEIRGPQLTAEVGVLTYKGEQTGLDQFFASLAVDWRGWPGERSWTSIEGELSLSAQRRGGCNHLTITLQKGAPRIWSATTEVRIEPGEETARLANDLAAFIAQTKNAT